jgi:hypothetical protein
MTHRGIWKTAWEAVHLIGSLDLLEDFKTNSYNHFKKTLQNNCTEAGLPSPQLTFGKIPQCHFIILDGTITHTDNNCKALPVTNPFIKSNIRYIGLNLKVETFAEQNIKFYLKYIQSDGTVKTGSSSLTEYSFSEEKTINPNTETISFLGWGHAEKSIYDIGTHYIEVWVDNCMIYRTLFVVALSPEEEMEQEERIEEEKRKKQAKIAKQKAQKKKAGIFLLCTIAVEAIAAYALWDVYANSMFYGIIIIIITFVIIDWYRISR